MKLITLTSIGNNIEIVTTIKCLYLSFDITSNSHKIQNNPSKEETIFVQQIVESLIKYNKKNIELSVLIDIVACDWLSSDGFKPSNDAKKEGFNLSPIFAISELYDDSIIEDYETRHMFIVSTDTFNGKPEIYKYRKSSGDLITDNEFLEIHSYFRVVSKAQGGLHV